MIDLKFKCEFLKASKPFVGKLFLKDSTQRKPVENGSQVEYMYDSQKGGYLCNGPDSQFFISCESKQNFDGDIFLFIPANQLALRIIRRDSLHNTILFTEQYMTRN